MTNPDSKATREGDVHTCSPRSAAHGGWWSADRCATYADFYAVFDRLTAAERENKALKAEVGRQTNLHNLHCCMEYCSEKERVAAIAARKEGK